MRVGSDTFGNPTFQKGLQNQPSSPIMSWVDLPSFATLSKIGHDFTICSGFKIEVTKKSC
jgi:hypothetical protein